MNVEKNRNVRPMDSSLLDEVTSCAAASARRRKNHNFHASDAEKCHRLLNAVEPDSYIPPHCHASPDKDETVVILRGKLGVLIFDGAGRVEQRFVLEPGGAVVGITVPHGVFHTSVSLASGTVFFEAKAGPYEPLRSEEKTAWAPPEGAPEAAAYHAWLKSFFA